MHIWDLMQKKYKHLHHLTQPSITNFVYILNSVFLWKIHFKFTRICAIITVSSKQHKYSIWIFAASRANNLTYASRISQEYDHFSVCPWKRSGRYIWSSLPCCDKRDKSTLLGTMTSDWLQRWKFIAQGNGNQVQGIKKPGRRLLRRVLKSWHQRSSKNLAI